MGSSPGERIGGGAGKLNIFCRCTLPAGTVPPPIPPPPLRLVFSSLLFGGVGSRETLPPPPPPPPLRLWWCDIMAAESLFTVKERDTPCSPRESGLFSLLPGDVDASWKGSATENSLRLPPPAQAPVLKGDSPNQGGESGRKTEEKESGDRGSGTASGEQLLIDDEDDNER